MDDTTATPPEPVQFTARLRPDLLDALRVVADNMDLSTNRALGVAVERFLEMRDADQARLDSPDISHSTVEVTGPWTSGAKWRLQVEGYPVPYIEVHKVEPPEGTPIEPASDGTYHPGYVLSLDDRFQTGVLSWGQLWTQAWFWANAMAIAAGFTSHGPHSYLRNPHGQSYDVGVTPFGGSEAMSWAEDGWARMAASGSIGKHFECDAYFILPNMADADQVAWEIAEQIRRVAEAHGARDVGTRTIAIGGMERDKRSEQPRPIIDTDALDQS